jgi:hypothetical protein
MKFFIFFVLCFCTVSSYSQRLFGRWIWPDDDHPPKIIVEFIDTNYMEIRVNEKFIISRHLIYRLDWNRSKAILKVKSSRSRNNHYDSCFIYRKLSNIILMYGGFMDKPINEVLNDLGENEIDSKFINVTHKHKGIYLYQKRILD